MKLDLITFNGIAPKISPYLLPDGIGQISSDINLDSGVIIPNREDRFIKEVPTDTKSIYLYKSFNEEDQWLTWNKEVDIIKSPIYNDVNNTIIINGIDENLRVTDSTMLTGATTVNDSNSYILGLPKLDGIEMELTGTSDDDGNTNVDSRSYVVALVREWDDGKLDVGALSAPATTSDGDITIDVPSGNTVTLTNIVVPNSYKDTYGVKYIYVYRTEVGATTVSYSYVDSITLNNSETYTFVDSLSGEELGEASVSQYWDAPQTNLNGLVSLNNGVVAAFKGNDIFFSYPYQPYAFPADYRITVDNPIVGLGAFGNTVVVCTTAYPVLLLVSDPATPTVTPIQDNIPCLSKGSIVNTVKGVMYSTVDGLILIASSSPQHITSTIMDRETWTKWNTKSMSSAFISEKYFGILKKPDETFGFYLDTSSIEKGLVTLSKKYNLVWSDIEQNVIYGTLNKDSKTYLIELFGNTNAYKQSKYKSKIYTTQTGLSTLSAARVVADYKIKDINTDYIKPYVYENNTLNSACVNTYTLNGNVNMKNAYTDSIREFSTTFSYYVDGKLKYTKYCTNTHPFRLPSGFRGRFIEIGIDGNTPVSSVSIASSIGELV